MESQVRPVRAAKLARLGLSIALGFALAPAASVPNAGQARAVADDAPRYIVCNIECVDPLWICKA